MFDINQRVALYETQTFLNGRLIERRVEKRRDDRRRIRDLSTCRSSIGGRHDFRMPP